MADISRRNEALYYLSCTLYNTAVLVVTGSVLQTFMLEAGIPEDTVAKSVSAFQVAQSATMILSAGLADRVRRIIPVCAVGMLNLLLLLVPMLIIAEGTTEALIPLFAAGLLQNILLGFYNVIVYKLPYHVMDMSRYGRVTANNGIMYGLTGILLSTGITWAVARFEYFFVMRPVILLAIVMTACATAAGFRYTPLTPPESTCPEGKKINLLRYRPFLALLVPNLTRGLGTGILGVAVTIGYYFHVIDKVSGGYLVIISNAAVILSGFIFSSIGKRGKSGILTLVSSLVMAASLPFMLIGNSTPVYLICYAVGYLAFNVLCVAIPVLITELIDYEVMGRFTAWRMMLLTVGSAIGGAVAIPLCEHVGGTATMALSAVMFLITGVGYFAYERKTSKKLMRDAPNM